MTTVHINARDHEEAHVASAKFLLPAADLRRAETEVARQLAVTVRWAEEKNPGLVLTEFHQDIQEG